MEKGSSAEQSEGRFKIDESDTAPPTAAPASVSQEGVVGDAPVPRVPQSYIFNQTNEKMKKKGKQMLVSQNCDDRSFSEDAISGRPNCLFANVCLRGRPASSREPAQAQAAPLWSVWFVCITRAGHQNAYCIVFCKSAFMYVCILIEDPKMCDALKPSLRLPINRLIAPYLFPSAAEAVSSS